MWIRFVCVVLLGMGWVTCPNALTQNAPDPWALLQEPDSTLRHDPERCEQLIDLVQAWVVDSVVQKEKQRLNGFGGWFIQTTWARYWSYIQASKQKYVGTLSRPYHVFDGPSDELDINVFVMPHTKRYVEMARAGFDLADARHRPDKGFRLDNPPNYPLPEALYFEKEHEGEKGYITIECEVTPSQRFAETLNKRFFPVLEGDYRLDSIPNFGTPYPSMGMTGVWSMDCNHNCRPEIHPIEWLWWLDLSPERPGSPTAKSWMVALMVDDSRRFHDWTHSPISGEISIPVTAPFGHTLIVNLEHIVSDGVESDFGSALAKQRYQTGDTAFMLPYIPERDIYPTLDLRLHAFGGWPRTGLRYWLSGIHPTDQGWQGYLNFSATMASMLAMRVTIDSAPAH